MENKVFSFLDDSIKKNQKKFNEHAERVEYVKSKCDKITNGLIMDFLKFHELSIIDHLSPNEYYIDGYKKKNVLNIQKTFNKIEKGNISMKEYINFCFDSYQQKEYKKNDKLLVFNFGCNYIFDEIKMHLNILNKNKNI